MSLYDHILIATDGWDISRKAVTHGLRLAKELGAKATAVTVTEPWLASLPGDVSVVFPLEDYEKAAAKVAHGILSQVEAEAKSMGVECTIKHVADRFASDGILSCAHEAGCDLIVMASHGRRGLARLLLGSEAVNVLTHSTIPVLICR